MKKLFFFVLVLLLSCDSSETQGTQGTNESNTEWLIPVNEVLDGGPGKDGIPAIDSPNFSSVADVDYLKNDDLVIGVIFNDVAKAYPHAILDWHEIVNDEVSFLDVGLTYCPLTGTGIAWDRNINGSITTFGVSGKLYNTNLIPYDRASDSYWSQMRLDCVNGDLIGDQISTYNVIETSWATWKKAYPNSTVMNTDTGHSRNYDQYPYGDYRTNHSRIIFPVGIDDNRLPAKERVLGLIEGVSKKVYSIELFEDDRVIEDQLDGNDIIIIGSKEANFIVAFDKLNLSNLTYVDNQLPVVAEDLEGNRITLSGEIISGPLMGTQLVAQKAFMGYFFAFGAFYEDIEIYEE